MFENKIERLSKWKREWEKNNLEEIFSRKRKLTSFDIWFYSSYSSNDAWKPSSNVSSYSWKKKSRLYFESTTEKFLEIIFKQKHTSAWKLKIMRTHPLQIETHKKFTVLSAIRLSGKNEFCYVLCAIGIVRPFLASVCSHYGIHNI